MAVEDEGGAVKFIPSQAEMSVGLKESLRNENPISRP